MGKKRKNNKDGNKDGNKDEKKDGKKETSHGADGKRHLPASRGKDEQGNRILTREEENIIQLMIEGASVASIARKLQPTDDRKRKALRSYIRRLARDVVFQDNMGMAVKVETILGLGPAVHALNRKAAAGRVDAIKLLFESSGFHNPRLQHDHSGEISITIKNAPRPDRVVEEYTGINTAAEPIVDATVVEE